MDGLLLFEEFELDIMKADHMYESALDKFAIEAMQMNSLINEGFYEESSDDTESMYTEAASKFLDAVKTWFNNLIEKIKKLITDLMIEIKAKQTAKDVNKKLSEIKKYLATNKSLTVNKKVKGIDTAKYFKSYTKYINEYVSGIKKVYSKNYDNYEEFEKVFSEFAEKMKKVAVDLKLFQNEVYDLSYDINEMIQYTEKEVASQESIAKAYSKMWCDALGITEHLSEKQTDTRVINSAKTSANKLTSVLSEGLKKIITNKNIMVTLGAVVGWGVGAKNAESLTGVMVKGTVGSVAGSMAGNAIAYAADKKLNKNVDTDKTTKTNIDNDNKSDQKN